MLGRLIPKSSDIWVFGAWEGKKYSDNSRYIFEYVLTNCPEIRAFWISDDDACFESLFNDTLPVLRKFSLKGIYYCLRANLVICSNGLSDVNEFCAAGSRKIMLWHGIPMKKIESDIISISHSRAVDFQRLFSRLLFKNRYLFPYLYPSWDLVLSTSVIIQDRMSSAFQVLHENVPILGYPRNDVLLSGNYVAINELISPCPRDAKFILYAPTFRETLTDNDALFNDFPLNKFCAFLENNNCYLFIKLHPILRNSDHQISHMDSKYIVFLDSAIYEDLNSILPNFDLMLTDYSGAYFDFLLLDRPMIFTPFDLESYEKVERGLYENYLDSVPGPICRNWDEVISALNDFFSGVDNYTEQRHFCKLRYHDHIDADSSKRVVKYLVSYDLN